MIALGLPLCICLFVSAAVYAAWRRRPESRHAHSWALAFALAGAGWLAAAVVASQAGIGAMPGMAAQLAWLAAGMSFVQGLRQRAGRRDRGPVLGATWAGIAFAGALLLDLASTPALAGSGAAMLSAIGLLIGAVAIGPRRRRARPIDWSGMLLLTVLALTQMFLAATLLRGGPAPWGIVVTALGASLAYVAAGLVTMLLIGRDLTLALERLARTDPLTTVWNRRGFDEAGPHLLSRQRRFDPAAPAAVAIADVDAFKAVNDRFGHLVGDAVLAHFAGMLARAVRRGDLLARLGGEEFVILAIGADARDLHARLEAVRQAMMAEADRLPGLPPVTASFGVADVAPAAPSLREALERADRALYRAKHEGRNRTVTDDSRAA